MGSIGYGAAFINNIPDRALLHLEAAIREAICEDQRTFVLELRSGDGTHRLLLSPSIPVHFLFSPEFDVDANWNEHWYHDIYRTFANGHTHEMVLVSDPGD
jgi:hypothetical protein